MKIFLLISFLLLSQSSFADFWPLPAVERYYSKDSTYFVEIVPTRIPENYAKWKKAKPKRKNKFSISDTTIVQAYAKMLKVENRDTIKVREWKLINPIAPVRAMISPNGNYVATFDDWHSVGYGPNVFVVYNNKGELVKHYSLDEITPFPMDSFFKSISSIWWRCEPEFISSEKLNLCFSDKNNQQKFRLYNFDLKEFEK